MSHGKPAESNTSNKSITNTLEDAPPTQAVFYCPKADKTMVEINVSQYLSDDEMKEIVSEVVREQVEEALRTERRVSNLIYEVAEAQIDKTMNSELGDGWRKRLIVKAAEALDNKDHLRFFLLRRADRFETTPGPAVEPINEAVKQHTGRLSNRIAEVIDDLDVADLGDVLYEAVALRLGGAK